jgi:hypothetical protein
LFSPSDNHYDGKTLQGVPPHRIAVSSSKQTLLYRLREKISMLYCVSAPFRLAGRRGGAASLLPLLK